MRLLCSLLVTLALTCGLLADENPDWTAPQTPFRIVGNLYYVGSKDLASYLVVTPQGDILINSNLTSSPALIRKSIETLGFHMKDVKILLISHAHSDHDGGSAAILRMTGAKYMVMEQDVPVVESGGRADFFYGRRPGNGYPPAKVARALHDGDRVELGGSVLVAHLTPGHTEGCTTWTMVAKDGGKNYNVVIIGSTGVNPGYRLVGKPSYPGIEQDYEKTFRVLKALPCDVFLGAHGIYFGLLEKYERMKDSSGNPFVDPEGYKSYVLERQQVFEAELTKQSAESAAQR